MFFARVGTLAGCVGLTTNDTRLVNPEVYKAKHLISPRNAYLD